MLRGDSTGAADAARMHSLTSRTPCATPRAAPRLQRRADGHLSLHCGASRRRRLKAWILLRLRYRFLPMAGGCLLVWGGVALRVRDEHGLTLASDSDLADALLRSLCGEL